MAKAKMLSKKSSSTLQGFTIIEVVLVLAIAGLIFLMVFIALPALQRSQRDTQRRDDLARVATALSTYESNNNGALPAASSFASGTTTLNHNARNSATALVSNYLNGASATTNAFLDPDGTAYGVTIATGALTVNPGAVDHVIHIQTGTRCGGEGQAVALTNQPRKFSILYVLENGVYCADNE